MPVVINRQKCIYSFFHRFFFCQTLHEERWTRTDDIHRRRLVIMLSIRIRQRYISLFNDKRSRLIFPSTLVNIYKSEFFLAGCCPGLLGYNLQTFSVQRKEEITLNCMSVCHGSQTYFCGVTYIKPLGKYEIRCRQELTLLKN